MKQARGNRYSISITGKTYDRLRSAVISGSMASFVDDIVAAALADPVILERIRAACVK